MALALAVLPSVIRAATVLRHLRPTNLRKIRWSLATSNGRNLPPSIHNTPPLAVRAARSRRCLDADLDIDPSRAEVNGSTATIAAYIRQGFRFFVQELQ